MVEKINREDIRKLIRGKDRPDSSESPSVDETMRHIRDSNLAGLYADQSEDYEMRLLHRT